MTFDPQRFFIGLVDFFSIFMPGAFVTFLGKDWASSIFPNLFSLDSDGAEGPAVFFFASYLLGHFLFLIGSLLDDLVYEPVTNASDPKQIARLLLNRKLSARPLRWLARVCFKKQPDRAIDCIVALKDSYLAKIGKVDAVNAFQWCKSRLTMEKPEALSLVNRFEADSKFFRSFVPVLAGLLLFVSGNSTYRLVISSPMDTSDGGLILGLALLLVLAFWRYMEQRFKATQQAYWFVLTIEASQRVNSQSVQPSPALSKTVSREDGLTHAGGVVIRQHNGKSEYLLVQAKNNSSERVLPKGHIEPGEDPRHCAIREVHEETGVWARIVRPVKVNEYTVGNDSVKVQFYLMEAVDEGNSENLERKSEWLVLEKALERTRLIEQTYQLFQWLQRGGTMTTTEKAHAVGSHALAQNYQPLPDGLKEDLVGTAYAVPSRDHTTPELLKGYRIALVTTHGPELPEFDIPLNHLRDRGAIVDIITQDWLFEYQPAAPGMVVLIQWLAANVCVKADKKISDARIEDYDAVVIIGGAWNPIMLRTDGKITDFIREAHRRRLLIASICHGPQVLISSRAFPLGTKATSVGDVRIDLANAGFQLPQEPEAPVVYDEHHRLLTSPNPEAIAKFCEELSARIREVEPVLMPAP